MPLTLYDPPALVEPVPPSGELLRCEQTRLRRRMLYGLWRSDLVARVALEIQSDERADAWGEPDLTGNLFRPTCSALSQLYTPDQPRVTAPAGGQDLVDAVVEGGLWDLMIRGQRDTIGMREWLVRVDAVPDPGDPFGWGLSFRPAFADRIMARGRADAPDLPAYVAEAILADVDGAVQWVWDVWDADTGLHYVTTALDGGGRVLEVGTCPTDENGQFVVPYSLYHAERTGCLWDPWEWLEIVEGSLRLGVDWTFFGHALLKASWPQRASVGVNWGGDLDETDGASMGDRLVVSGAGGLASAPTGRTSRPRNRVASDPALLLQGQVDPEYTGTPILHQWAAGAPLTEIANAISTYERRIAALAGINPADIQRVTGDPRSGYAIEISRDEQDRARKRFEPTFRRGDLETLRVAAAVLSAASGVQIPGIGYAIEYGPQDEAEGAAPRAQNAALATAITQTVASVASGAIPRDAGVAILATAFHLDPEIADELVGSAGKEPDPAAGAVDGAAPAGAASVQDTALNGAQVTSLVQIVEDVAAGKLPRDAAVAICQRAFQVDAAEAERLLGSAGTTFKVEPPAPPPAFGGVGGGRPDGSGGANPQDGGGAGRSEGGGGGAPSDGGPPGG